MTYNLLQRRLDMLTERFVEGLIDYNTFERLEKWHNEQEELFTIHLN